ncbi:Hypothetical protein SCF082_LOCUS50455 [Durusdinium trenchii]|uniref:Uncharacterized protein n=1 Tax=Durusdinium trenchii TaxID=1381693 RepID=A0ABP0S835_9DINO
MGRGWAPEAALPFDGVRCDPALNNVSIGLLGDVAGCVHGFCDEATGECVCDPGFRNDNALFLQQRCSMSEVTMMTVMHVCLVVHLLSFLFGCWYFWKRRRRFREKRRKRVIVAAFSGFLSALCGGCSLACWVWFGRTTSLAMVLQAGVVFFGFRLVTMILLNLCEPLEKQAHIMIRPDLFKKEKPLQALTLKLKTPVTKWLVRMQCFGAFGIAIASFVWGDTVSRFDAFACALLFFVAAFTLVWISFARLLTHALDSFIGEIAELRRSQRDKSLDLMRKKLWMFQHVDDILSAVLIFSTISVPVTRLVQGFVPMASILLALNYFLPIGFFILAVYLAEGSEEWLDPVRKRSSTGRVGQSDNATRRESSPAAARQERQRLRAGCAQRGRTGRGAMSSQKQLRDAPTSTTAAAAAARRTAVDLTRWTELDVLALLIEQELIGSVSLGLVNGRQLAEMTPQDCVKAVDASAKGNREQIGKELFQVIQRAKRGEQQSGKAATSHHQEEANDGKALLGEKRLESDWFVSNDLEQQLLPSTAADGDEEEEDARAVINPEDHVFPPLCDRPGRLSATVMGVVLVGTVACCTVLRPWLAKTAGMEDDESGFVREFLRYESIPVLMVPFTYFHIWMALWMTFFPIHFRGCCQIPGTNVGFPIGWQGIVPFKCVEMAKLAVRMLTSKLLQVDEVFSRLDPTKVSAMLEPEISKDMTRIIDDIAADEAPRLWGLLPNKLKEQVFKQAARESPAVVANLMGELQTRVDECFDLEDLVVGIMVNDMELSNNMFIQCADRELAFIRNSGAWMGGIFGIGQMIVSIYFQDSPWVLPVVGLVAGAITNWIALFAIFHPADPISLCGGRVVLQGLFLTRQKSVSALYGHIVKNRILTAENLVRALMQGPRKDVVNEIAQRHILHAYENAVKPLRVAGPQALQPALDRVGNRLAQAMSRNMYGIMRSAEPYMDQVFDLENTLRTRMRALPPTEFEGLLHPVFQEDEWKLVVCGGALGAIFGLVQAKLIGF